MMANFIKKGPKRVKSKEDTPPNVLCLSLIHISEPTRLGMISYAVFCFVLFFFVGKIN